MTFKPCVTNCDKDIVFHRNSIFKINFLTMAKEKIINIRVEAELKKQAKKLADQDGRSLSNWILKLIKNEIKKSQQEAVDKAD